MPSWERMQEETEPAFEAFRCYLGMPYSDMPTGRSLSKLAQRLGKSKTLLDRWSAVHRWQERCRAYDREIQGEELEARKIAVKEMQRKHINLSSKLTKKAREALEKLEPDTMKPWDIANFLKLALELERRARFELLAESELGAKSDSDAVSYSPMVKLIESLEQARAERQKKEEGLPPKQLVIQFSDFDKDEMTDEEREQYEAIKRNVYARRNSS